MTHNFKTMAARVRLLVDSVAFKTGKLAEVSAGIKDNRDQADAYQADAKHHHNEAARLADLSSQHRHAANRQIDEEATLKSELKSEQAELDQIREAFDEAGIQLPAAREMGRVCGGDIAGNMPTPTTFSAAEAAEGLRETSMDVDLDDAIAAGVELADEAEVEERAANFTGPEQAYEVEVEQGFTEVGEGAVTTAAQRVEIEMGDAKEPTADQVRDKLDSFVERVRNRGGEVDVSVEEVREVISGVHEVTAEEAIAAGEEDAAELDDDPEVETISGEENVA